MRRTIRRFTSRVNGAHCCSTNSPVAVHAYEGVDQKSLLNDGLFRLVQMFLEVGHEGCAARSHGSGVALVGLMLAKNITVGVADVDLAELGKEIDAAAIGGPDIGVA